MRKIIKKLLFNRIIFKLVRLCVKIYEASIIEQNSKNLIMGKESRLYPEAKIINMQKNACKIVLGENTHIRGMLQIFPHGKGMRIGSNSYVGDHSRIWASDFIEIGNSVLIAHNVTIIDSDSHEIDFNERERSAIKIFTSGHPKEIGNVKTAPIVIKDNAWISYNVSILKGVTVGKGAIVGAGSVVTKDVPDWSVVAGNPARVVRLFK